MREFFIPDVPQENNEKLMIGDLVEKLSGEPYHQLMK